MKLTKSQKFILAVLSEDKETSCFDILEPYHEVEYGEKIKRMPFRDDILQLLSDSYIELYDWDYKNEKEVKLAAFHKSKIASYYYKATNKGRAAVKGYKYKNIEQNRVS